MLGYGGTKKKSCCYKCQKRVVGCHASCPDYIKETEERAAEKRARIQFLYPTTANYFKRPEMVSTSASQSKKRYR